MAGIFRLSLIEIVMLSDRHPTFDNVVRLLPSHTLGPFLDILLNVHVFNRGSSCPEGSEAKRKHCAYLNRKAIDPSPRSRQACCPVHLSWFYLLIPIQNSQPSAAILLEYQ